MFFLLVFIFYKSLAQKNELEIKHLKSLKELGIDLNNHLISSISVPNKVVQLKNDQNNNDSTRLPNIHFHDKN